MRLKWYDSAAAFRDALVAAGLDLRPTDLDADAPNWEVDNCRVSYYPTTGTVQIQGKAGFVAALCRKIVDACANNPAFEATS